MYDPTKPNKKEILDLVVQTWNTPHVSVEGNLVVKKFSFPEYHHSDGIGTKGLYLWKSRGFKQAVTDALAMNLNDLLVVGATPYALVDHIIIPRDDRQTIYEIMSALVDECKKRNLAITGGETAIHNDFDSMEISISMLGFVERRRLNQFRAGDVLVGLESNGLHASGFTKIREVFGRSTRPEFIKPTFIYWDSVFPLLGSCSIQGMVNITGGAFSRFKGLLDNVDLIISRDHSIEPQKIFYDLYTKGISDEEMYKTFNCGIGFVVALPRMWVDEFIHKIRPLRGSIIGELTAGQGRIIIQSKFSDTSVVY